MFIRFVVDRLDPDSGRRQGLFHAGSDLAAGGVMSEADYDEVCRIRSWFNDHLRKPDRFALSASPHAKAQALSWFRDSARTHVSNMRAYAAICERNGLWVQVLKTKRPGYVVYRDDHQVTAYPFADTQA